MEAVWISLLAAAQAVSLVSLLIYRSRMLRLTKRLDRLGMTVDRHTDKISDVFSRTGLLQGDVDVQLVSLVALQEDLQRVQDHVGVVTPEQLSRLAAIDHIRQEYRSLGLAVDADELDETQLQELGQALLTLKVAPVRRETDAEVDGDLQALFDNTHPGNQIAGPVDDTGPLPHAVDATDEQPAPFNGGSLADWPGNAS